MEQLIALVMDNFYVVFVIIGVVYSLFFRKSPQERPPNRMPDFGGDGTRPGRSGEPRPNAARTVGNRTQSPDNQESVLRQLPEPPSRIEDWRQATIPKSDEVGVHELLGASKEHWDEESAKPARKSQGSAGDQQQLALSQHKKRIEAALSRDDLSRAIMWAEILGPPRAKRPHRR